MQPEAKYNLITRIVVMGFALAVIFHYIAVNYLDLAFYPFGTFLYTPLDRFGDFFNMYKAAEGFNPYASYLSVYFPFTFMIMYLFTLLKPLTAFTLFLLIFGGYFLYYLYQNINLADKGSKFFTIFVFIAMSYPFLFSIDRANVECWVFIFLALFFTFYQKKKDGLAVIFLSFAIAMKAYPAVFLVLFLVDRKYKNIAATLFLSLGLTLFSAEVLPGGVVGSLQGLQKSLSWFYGHYIHPMQGGLQHSVSIFSIIKMFIMWLAEKVNVYFIGALFFFYYTYTFFALLIFAGLSVILKRKPMLYWQKVTLLVFAMLLLPQVSFDYKLIHLFIPLLLFLNCSKSTKFDWWYTILFGLLLIPKHYYIVARDVSSAVFINPLLMLIILFLIFKDRPKVLEAN